MIKKYRGLNAISALPDIFNELFPGSNLTESNDLVKQDPSICKMIVQSFQKNNIYGWYTSWEGGLDCEICIFPPNLDEYVNIELIDRNIIENNFTVENVIISLSKTLEINKNKLIKKIDEYKKEDPLVKYDLEIILQFIEQV